MFHNRAPSLLHTTVVLDHRAIVSTKEQDMRIFTLTIVATLCALFLGCANPSIVKLSPDTYLLTKEDHAGIFGSMAKLKADVISQANTFAESQGKIAIPIHAKERPVGGPRQWASFEYQFRVVDKDDPEARRTSLAPAPDLTIDKTEKVNVDIKSKDLTSKDKDVYTELIRLDDLRNRGIITEEEFQTLKKKLRASNDI